VLAALEGAIGSGGRAHLIREGCERGEVVLLMSDGSRLAATFGQEGTERKIELADRTKIRRTAEWIAQHLNGQAFSPVQFLLAKPKDQIAQLLKMTPLQMEVRPLREAITGVPCEGVRFLDDMPDDKMLSEPLVVIDLVRKAVYDSRTGVNAILREKKGHVAVMERDLPGRMDVPESPEDVRAELEGVKYEAESKKKAVDNTLVNDLVSIKEILTDGKTKIAAELTRKIQELRDEAEREIGKITQVHANAEQRIRDAHRTNIDAIDASTQPRIQELSRRLGVAETEIREYEAAERQRASLREAEKGVHEYEKRADAATEAIKKLDALKMSLQQKLPCGFQIHGDELRLGGVPFATTNTSRRVRAAVELAMLQTNPQMPWIAVDGLEALDADAQRELQTIGAERPEIQWFGARVLDNGDGLQLLTKK